MAGWGWRDGAVCLGGGGEDMVGSSEVGSSFIEGRSFQLSFYRYVFGCYFTDTFSVVNLQMNFHLLFSRQVFSCHLADEFPVVI